MISNIVDVGTIADTVTKGTTPTSIGYNFSSEGIPFLRVNNIQGGLLDTRDVLFIDLKTNKALARSVIHPNDVLLSIAGTIGRSAVVPPNTPVMNCNQAVAIIRLSNKVDPKYFCLWLNSNGAFRQITGSKVTGTISNLSLGCIKKLKIPLPPLEEQKRIAVILDKADAIRRSRQKAIVLTVELLQSTFLEMFGDPVTNPKGWNLVKLEQILGESFQNGAYYPKDKYSNGKDTTEMVHMSDAFYGVVQPGNLKRVLASKKEVEKYELVEGDVLITRRSLNYEGSAKPCLIPKLKESLIFESSLIRVRVNREIIDPIFFYSYMLQPQARAAFVFPYVTKSTISGINQAGLKKVKIIVPPIDLQLKYKQIYNEINHMVNNHEDDLKQTDNLFNSLLQKAFRGEL